MDKKWSSSKAIVSGTEIGNYPEFFLLWSLLPVQAGRSSSFKSTSLSEAAQVALFDPVTLPCESTWKTALGKHQSVRQQNFVYVYSRIPDVSSSNDCFAVLSWLCSLVELVITSRNHSTVLLPRTPRMFCHAHGPNASTVYTHWSCDQHCKHFRSCDHGQTGWIGLERVAVSCGASKANFPEVSSRLVRTRSFR